MMLKPYSTGLSMPSAERILHRLHAHEPAAVDDPAATWSLDDPRLRSQAVKASVEAATTLLPLGGAERFTELGSFAEDEPTPVSTVALLWLATGRLTEAQTRRLCRDLARLSLLTLDPRHGGRIGIHDVIRDGLGTAGLARLNGLVVDAIAATLPPAQLLTPTASDPECAWWQLEDGYLLDHLIDHLVTARGRTPTHRPCLVNRWPLPDGPNVAQPFATSCDCPPTWPTKTGTPRRHPDDPLACPLCPTAHRSGLRCPLACYRAGEAKGHLPRPRPNSGKQAEDPSDNGARVLPGSTLSGRIRSPRRQQAASPS